MTIESDPTQNLAKIRSLAIDTFCSELVAESWLNQHHALLGVAPIVAAKSSSGYVDVQKLLSAINYGGAA